MHKTQAPLTNTIVSGTSGLPINIHKQSESSVLRSSLAGSLSLHGTHDHFNMCQCFLAALFRRTSDNNHRKHMHNRIETLA